MENEKMIISSVKIITNTQVILIFILEYKDKMYNDICSLIYILSQFKSYRFRDIFFKKITVFEKKVDTCSIIPFNFVYRYLKYILKQIISGIEKL